MIISVWIRHARRTLLATGAVLALATGVLVGTATTSQAATQQPCDIYASGGTPCVAAHSTTRALYAAYNGPLYQVRRASDNVQMDAESWSRGEFQTQPGAPAEAKGAALCGSVARNQRS